MLWKGNCEGQKGTEMDVNTVYIVAGVLGLFAGLARFLQSREEWSVRGLCASMLVGSILAVGVPAWMFGNEASKNPWKAIAVALAVGLFQPEGAKIIQSIIKSIGGSGGNGDTSRKKGDRKSDS